MSVRVDVDWKYRGLQVVRLENKFLCIDVLPELGAKVFNFIYKPLDRNLLWHNPGIPPSRQCYGTGFDDVWSGGWDELIPNDIPFQLQPGETLPDHGEVWSQKSEWDVSENSMAVSASFINCGRVVPIRFEKIITLRAKESMCNVSYRLTNNWTKSLKFLWNIHPPMSISPQTKLDVPASRCITDTWGTADFKERTEFQWPIIVYPGGGRLDLSLVPPPERGIADFHYLPDIEGGWYAVTDTASRSGWGFVFDTGVFPHLWLFRSIGGWRGLYTLILEASTGYPNDLSEAISSGNCAFLESGQTVETSVKAIAYRGCGSVEKIDPDGSVVARKSE